MIVKVNGRFVVKSEEGKNLSKPLPSKKKASERLAQVEWYKSHKK